MTTRLTKPLTRSFNTIDAHMRRHELVVKVDVTGLAFRVAGTRRWVPASWAFILKRLHVREGSKAPAAFYQRSFADYLHHIATTKKP